MSKPKQTLVRAGDLHQEWMQNPQYVRAWEALEEEFALAETLISARNRANLSQEQLAAKMGTAQSFIARLESGKSRPSTATLKRYAEATGSKLRIMLEPVRQPQSNRAKEAAE